MDRVALERMLDEGMSLAEIGRRVERHESTVGHWMRRYGLETPKRERHAAKGGLGRAELTTMVGAGRSIAEIAQTVGRSKATVRYWLDRHGLRTAGRRGARAREGALEARAAGLNRASLSCPRHGVCEHVREARGYYRCRSCRKEAVVRRRRRVKELLVAEFGGRCQMCGYDACVAALEFHHQDPGAKEFGLATRGAHAIERLRAEARKCVLVCSNCHAEIESGARSISG